MQTQDNENGEKYRYSLLFLQVSRPPMHHNGSRYIPQIGYGGSN